MPPFRPDAVAPAAPARRPTLLRWSVGGPFAAVLLLLVLVNAASVWGMSATRAYAAGEGLWRSSQTQAAAALMRFVHGGDPRELEGVDALLAVPRGDRRAREAMERSPPDHAAARAGLLAGRNPPQDIDGMVRLYTWFRHLPHVADAIAVWREGDVEIERLAALADALRDAPDAAAREALLGRLVAIEDRLTMLSERFAAHLGDASRLAAAIAVATNAGLAVVLLAAGAVALRSGQRRLAHSDRALAASGERWALASRAAGLVVFDRAVAADGTLPPPGDGDHGEFLERVDPADRGMVQAAIDRARRSGSEFGIEFRAAREAGGEARWLTAFGRFRHEAPDGPLRLAGVMLDTTARKVAELDNLEWRHRYELTTDASGQIVYDWRPDADIVQHAGPVARILGHAPGEVDGSLERWLALIEPEDRARYLDATRRTLAQQTPLRLQYRMRRRDGAVITVEDTGNLMLTPDGRVRRVIGIVADVTERVQASAALAASELRYRTLWETSPDGVLLMDEQGRVVHANGAVERIFGYAPGALVGSDIARLQPARLRAAHRQGLARHLQHGRPPAAPRATETTGLHRDGHELPIEISFSHAEFGSGHLFAAFIRDISARKAEDAERRRLADFLARSLNEVYAFDVATRRLVYANAAAQAALGGRGVGTGVTLDELGPGWALHDVAAQVDMLVRGERERLVFEAVHRRPDGSEYPVQVHLQRAGTGEQPVVLAMAHDITERQRADRARAELMEQLRESQKVESLGTLAGGIAHDFNNVLAAILGNGVLALDTLPPGHGATAHLQQVIRAAERARNLVHQILSFSRRQPAALVDQPLQPLIDETVALLRASIPAGVPLRLRLPAQPVHAGVDAAQFSQVLMNLCTNAWHALQGRQGAITVTLDTVATDEIAHAALLPARDGGWAHVAVHDEGCGMDAATRAKIFEPFFTTKPVGQGTGLGLSVVHGIVAEHDGHISVDSQPGAGTSFHVYLPLRPAPAAAEPAPARVRTAAAGQGQRVLVVDDDELMVVLMARLFERDGYAATCFGDSAAALRELRAQPQRYELVVTDFNMPVHSGLEIAETAMRLNPAVRVVVTSGYISDELAAGAARVGVHALIHKEHTVDELMPAVALLLAAEHEAAA